jgi:hypothetical protein
MSWFDSEKSHNFPALASRDVLPNLWLKYERSDRTPLNRDDCHKSFATLTAEMRSSATHGVKAVWKSLDDFDAEHQIADLQDWLENVKWPKVGKQLRDPIGHTVCELVPVRALWCGSR